MASCSSCVKLYNEKIWTTIFSRTGMNSKCFKASCTELIIYNLTHEELESLQYGLDHHILPKINRNNIKLNLNHFFKTYLVILR